MKIIEAMKRVKMNKEKISDLQKRIAGVSAHRSIETPMYGDETKAKIREWAQSCDDITRDNVDLLCRIAKTNLATQVTITLGDKAVTKSIAAWVWRRREYAAIDMQTWSTMTDRGIKEGNADSSTGVPIEIKLIRNYDPELRDRKIAEYKSEPHEIDTTLEVINAVTDLVD